MALNLDYDHEWKPDAPKSAGPNLDFDPDWKPAPAPKGGLVASAKQAIGSTIKGAGQAAADFLPGVGQENALKTYGQSVVDANPTAVHSLADLKANPLTGVAEATGNAGGSMGAMLGARALGTGITAAAPFTGPAAPLVAGIGQVVSWAGPAAAAALPSFGGIREKQIQDDPTQQDSAGSKLLAAAGAGTVGLIESKLGPNKWAEMAMSKQGRDALAEKFVAKSLTGSIAKGAAKGAAIEGAEEIAQNPIEQIASYQNPLTADNLKDTAFSGVMGALGGGVFGGASGAAFRKGAENKPAAAPEAAPADQPIPYAPTTVEEVAKQRADAMGVKPENGPISAAASLAIEGQTAEEMRLATPGILAQGAAVAEQARIAQEARQAAEPGIPYEPVAVEAPQAAPIVPTVPMVDPQIPAQDWINQQTGVDQSSGVTRRDFEAAAKEQADPQTILDESGRPKTTTSALEIQQFHADFDRREALRQRNLSAAERLRAARGGKPLVEDAQPADVAPQPSAPVVDIAQPDIADEAPARIARPAPSPASGGSSAPAMPSVSSLISQGATLQGKNLVDASNNVVLPNLNIQQYREANTLLKSKPSAQAAETPSPSIPVQAAPQGPKQQSAGREASRNYVRNALSGIKDYYKLGDLDSLQSAFNKSNDLSLLEGSDDNAIDWMRSNNIKNDLDSVRRKAKAVEDLHDRFPAEFKGGLERANVYGGLKSSDPVGELISHMSIDTGRPESDFRKPKVVSQSLTTEAAATIKPDLTVQAPATGKQSLQVQPENSNGNARPASETVPPVRSPQGSVNARSVGNLRTDGGSGTGGQAVRNDAAEPVASVPDSRASGSGERVAEPVSKSYKLPLNLRDKNAALVEMASLMGKSDKDVRESFSAMWKRDGRESAEKRLVATVERLRAEKTAEATQKESSNSVSTESNSASAKSSANQNPIKAETRTSTGPETESASVNQETVKPSPALESLFADLDSSTVRKAKKAAKAAKLHPQAAEIDYVQNNYHDILIQLMDAGKLEVNGSKSVTEENESCL